MALAEAECECEKNQTNAFGAHNGRNAVALCSHCYIFVSSLNRFDSNETNINKRANAYCNSLGGVLKMPTCINDPLSFVFKLIKGKEFLPGLYFGVMDLPNLYRQEIVSEDMTVLYHSVRIHATTKPEKDQCIVTEPDSKNAVILRSCELISRLLDCAIMCEFKSRGIQQKQNHFDEIVLSNPRTLPNRMQLSLVMCLDGYLTRAFLLCDPFQYDLCCAKVASPYTFSGRCSSAHNYNTTYDLGHNRPIPVPTLPCDSETTELSFTQVCDFITDCHDKSDESFCIHPLCIGTFTCANAFCVSYDDVCNRVSHCQDESDESSCKYLRIRTGPRAVLASPVLVTFNGVESFVSSPMKANESCPDTHYRCPGAMPDCVPVFTRCNGVYDCVGHQDEEGCERLVCAGLMKCSLSAICIHINHLCDGWPHCPMRDDELSCDVVCPMNCLCQGHTFLCAQPFPASHYPQLRSLDVTGSGMALSAVRKNSYLVHVIFSKCSVVQLPDLKLLNLKILDLSSNMLQHVNTSHLGNLINLKTLSLLGNPLTLLTADDSADAVQDALVMLDASETSLTEFDSKVLAKFSHLQKLNLSFTQIHTVGPGGFLSLPRLVELYMHGSPVETFRSDIFQHLSNLRVISTENYKLCCSQILPDNFIPTDCQAPKDEISSCKDLLQSWTYRVFLWLITCLSVTGNVFCFFSRILVKSLTSSSGYGVFVTSLSMSDFLMGVYIAVIGVADSVYRGRYLHYDDTWKTSAVCKMAGFLSLLSNEVSALVIWLITLDRFLVLRFPFSSLRFDRTSAAMACLLIWMVGWCLALVPVLPATAEWEFYGQTGICIPLPVTRREFKGRVYSFSVLIVLNFVLFLFVSLGQAFIYWSVKKNALETDATKASHDVTVARRLITVATTDFMCWFPVGLCGVLALADVPVPVGVTVALAIFILPLNSAINPFIYTFNILAEKQRKCKEAKLLQWLDTQADLIKY